MTSGEAWAGVLFGAGLLVALLLLLIVLGRLHKLERMLNASLHREAMIRAAIEDLEGRIDPMAPPTARDPDS